MPIAGKDLDSLSAHTRLQQLAQTPHDLTAADGLSQERLAGYRCQAADIDLLYATQRVNDTTLDALQQLADESGVIDQFLAMKQGAALNRIEGYESENRQVLHTACRDIFHNPAQAPEASSQATEELVKLRRFLGQLDKHTLCNSNGKSFTDLVHIGIGGSDLGPRALYIALQAHCLENRRVHFISNVDPDDAHAVLAGLDLSRTLVNVVSKSGTTLETLTNEEPGPHRLSKRGTRPQPPFYRRHRHRQPHGQPRPLPAILLHVRLHRRSLQRYLHGRRGDAGLCPRL